MSPLLEIRARIATLLYIGSPCPHRVGDVLTGAVQDDCGTIDFGTARYEVLGVQRFPSGLVAATVERKEA